MRLGVFLPPIDRRPTGVGVFTLELTKRLHELNRDLTLFSERREHLPLALAGIEHQTPGGAWRLLGRLLPRRLLRRAVLDNWLPGRLELAGVDALLIPFHDGPRRGRCPQAIVVHDLTIERFPDGYPTAVRSYHHRVIRPILRGADRLIAVSRSTAADLEERLGVAPTRIRTVYEGFDREVFAPAEDDEVAQALRRHRLSSPYLLYAGTLAKHKNLEVVLRALALLVHHPPHKTPPDTPRLRLALSGRTDAARRRSIEALARELGIGDRIVWLGYVERRDLALLMNGCAAFVFPSLSEGFGLSALEAMACGAIVLASDRGSLPEVVGDGGELLDPHDETTWAGALSQVMAHSQHPASPHKAGTGRQADRHRRALAQAQRFDWTRCAHQVLAALEEMSAEGGS